MMPERQYYAPGGKAVRRFRRYLSDNIWGVWEHIWNKNILNVLQTVILKCMRHMTGAQTIIWRIGKCLDVWEVGQQQILVENTDHTCE